MRQMKDTHARDIFFGFIYTYMWMWLKRRIHSGFIAFYVSQIDSFLRYYSFTLSHTLSQNIRINPIVIVAFLFSTSSHLHQRASCLLLFFIWQYNFTSYFLLIYLLLLKRRKWKSEHACKQNQKEWKRKKDKRSREEKGIKNLFALIDIKYFIQLTIKFQKILQFMNLNRIFQPHSLVRIKQQWKPTEKEEKKSWKISLQY